MIHYTCDRCCKTIDPATDLRYEVQVVTQVVLESPDVDLQMDEDHLSEVDELLERVDDEECDQLCNDLYQSRRFDLCSNCYQQYKLDPLGAEAQRQVEFSEN